MSEAVVIINPDKEEKKRVMKSGKSHQSQTEIILKYITKKNS